MTMPKDFNHAWNSAKTPQSRFSALESWVNSRNETDGGIKHISMSIGPSVSQNELIRIGELSPNGHALQVEMWEGMFATADNIQLAEACGQIIVDVSVVQAGAAAREDTYKSDSVLAKRS